MSISIATTESKLPKSARATITATWGTAVRQATLTIDPRRPRLTRC